MEKHTKAGNLPTAEELFKEYADYTALSESHYDYLVDKESFIEALHKFAKLHVQAALESVIKVTHKNGIPRIVDNKESILNVYPNENIK